MLPELESLPPGHRSGFVAVIGRPNVGKSTLLNRLLGQKVAITSPKPQTTRDQLLGIYTDDNTQIVFLDTPGIHKPEHGLGQYMMEVVKETIADVDIILWLVDVHVPPKPEDRRIAELLQAQQGQQPFPPIIIGLNKYDAPQMAPEVLAVRQDQYRELLAGLPTQEPGERAPVSVLSFSALNGLNVDRLMETVRDLLPEGPRYYPTDQVTDLQVRFLVAELIREKALMLLQQEIPHSVAVVVNEYTQRNKNLTYIEAVIYVERRSQKGIVLGQQGSMIKRIGQSARPDIENLVGTKVYLELWVKIWEKWRKREGMLRRLGYATRQ